MGQRDEINKATKKKDNNNNELPPVAQEISSDDYSAGSVIWQEKVKIANQIKYLMNIDDVKLNIINNETGEIDEVYTALFKNNTKNNNFWKIFGNAMVNSLMDENGGTGLRVMGGITNPKIYIVDGMVMAHDLMNSNRILFLTTSFRMSRGSLTSITTETYEDRTGILTTQSSFQYSSEGHPMTRTEKIKVKYLPYVIFHPTLNLMGDPVSIFWYMDKDLELLNQSYRSLWGRLKYANFYILPHINMFQKGHRIYDLFKGVIIPLTDKVKGIDNNEAFSVIDPDQNNTTLNISNRNSIKQQVWDEMGVQNIEFQGSYQKNDREVEMLKQKEYNLINRLTKYFGGKAEEVVDLLIPDGFHTEIEFKGQEIPNKELEFEKTKEKVAMGVLTPDEAKDEMEENT